MNLHEKITHINKLAEDFGLTVKFDSEFKKLFIYNPTPGRQRIKAITDLSLESVKESLFWVASSSKA